VCVGTGKAPEEQWCHTESNLEDLRRQQEKPELLGYFHRTPPSPVTTPLDEVVSSFVTMFEEADGPRARSARARPPLTLTHNGPGYSPQGIAKPFEGGQLEVAEGGNVVGVHVKGVFLGKRKKRGEIWEFSNASARRLLTLCNAVDRQAIDVLRMVFLTLTYPEVWPAPGPAGSVWKSQHKAFVKRFERKWGKSGIISKLEPQKRGAPHFHMLILLPYRYDEVMGTYAGIECWAKQAWYEVVGSGDEKHLHNGAHCEGLRSWNGVTGYCSSYMAKKGRVDQRCFIDKSTGEVLRVGRYWMVHRRELFRTRWVSRHLGASEYILLTRWLRRFVQRRSWPRCRVDMYAGGTFFVDGDTWLAVLEHRVFREAVREREAQVPAAVRACQVFGGGVVDQRPPEPEVTEGAARPPSAGENPKLPREGKNSQTL